MRFGIRRTALRLGLACLAVIATLATASANDIEDFYHHPSIPREVPAMDLNTGQPYYAPPVPNGHYAKDGLGASALGHLCSPFAKAKGLLHHGKACGSCGGKGCGACGGSGLCGDGGKGCGLFHHGAGGGGCGGGDSCGAGGKSCGLFHHGAVAQGPSFVGYEGGGHGGCGGGHAVSGGPVMASCQSPEFVTPCGTCGGSGVCGGQGCGSCGGKGCLGGLFAKHCGGQGCGDRGCGNCFGGNFDPCRGCGGKGCGLCKGMGKRCHGCGGRGCGLCMGLKGKLLGGLYGLTHPHAGEIEYFVGAGGPVPITPGYVPYVVTTRSPRDFFAFPPFSPDANP